MTNKQAMYQYVVNDKREPRHIWSVAGERGGIHVSIWATDIRPSGYIGGIEIHWRNRPDWMDRSEPDHEHCWLLNGPCWHDGSSLQATEYWIPLWLSVRGQEHEHQTMFDYLWGEYAQRFEVAENES